MTMNVRSADGQSESTKTSIIGHDGPPLELVDLLAATQRVKQSLAALRRSGLAARLYDDHDEARAALRRLLERARTTRSK